MGDRSVAGEGCFEVCAPLELAFFSLFALGKAVSACVLFINELTKDYLFISLDNYLIVESIIYWITSKLRLKTL